LSGAGAMSRWGAFLRERYEPASHLVMAACFALGNGAVAVGAADAAARPSRMVAAIVVAFVFFLRLRVFDEIKDYDTDVAVNPARPLARGLIDVGEARRVALGLAVVESMIVLAIEPSALLAWLLSFVYSLAMFAEFGVGAWLRPRLELYAVTHTFVAALLGTCVASLVTGQALWELPFATWLLAPANWAVFNVFEFSRKTFAPSEERTGVPTYSNRLGPWGASALTTTCAAAALVAALLRPSGSSAAPTAAVALVLGFTALGLAVVYAARPARRSARAFRGGMIGWAIAYYAALAATRLA
jgi:hypothetical protein